MGNFRFSRNFTENLGKKCEDTSEILNKKFQFQWKVELKFEKFLENLVQIGGI